MRSSCCLLTFDMCVELKMLLEAEDEARLQVNRLNILAD
jgi:hypothetical protein